MNSFLEIAGQICKILIPIHGEVFYGNSRSNIGICTLSSMRLLRQITESGLLEKVAVAGRLLSENKGIDALVKYTIKNPTLDTIIVCGDEVSGHRAGRSLILLHKYGTDKDNRIISSPSPDPILSSSESEIRKFQSQVKIIDMIGKTNLDEIRSAVDLA
ncbi:MAG: tetrahydromethanopterin S-methyltransferase subunit A [Candidatus Nitrosotenuis sp.]